MFSRSIRILQIAIKEHGPLKFCVMIFVFLLEFPEPNVISLRYQTSAFDDFICSACDITGILMGL
jgi:hypothetical protein